MILRARESGGGGERAANGGGGHDWRRSNNGDGDRRKGFSGRVRAETALERARNEERERERVVSRQKEDPFSSSKSAAGERGRGSVSVLDSSVSIAKGENRLEGQKTRNVLCSIYLFKQVCSERNRRPRVLSVCSVRDNRELKKKAERSTQQQQLPTTNKKQRIFLTVWGEKEIERSLFAEFIKFD